MKKVTALFAAFVLLFHAHAQDAKLDEYLAGPGVFNGTALVVYKGKTLLHKGYGFKNNSQGSLNDTSTIFRIGSLSKSFTAAVIMRLVQEGRIHVSDPLSAYIPGYPQGDSIALEQLLTHHSGIKEYLLVKAVRDLPDGAPPVTMQQMIDYFKDEGRKINTKKPFQYSNSNYVLLAAVIEKVTGVKFEHYLRAMIFDPLQMQHSGFDFLHLSNPDKATGYEFKKKIKAVTDFDSSYAPGCGSMYATTGDLFAWYKGLYSGKVLNDSTREAAFVPRNWKYGYGWFSYTLYGKRCISHPGGIPGFVADMKFFPDDDLCIILLSNYSKGKAEADKIAAIVFQTKFERPGL